MSSPVDLDTEEVRLLERTMAKVLSGAGEGPELMTQLRELGWFELWLDQPRGAARALFGQQGRLVTTSPMLTLLMGSALTGNDYTQPVLMPEPRDCEGWCRPRLDGTLHALAQTDALAGAGQALLAIRDDKGGRLLRVEVAALRQVPIEGLDPALRLCGVDATAALRSAIPLERCEPAERAWQDALALGRRLLAEEMLGVVAEQLRLALEHAGTRSQFGRTIGSFQAVKHKLAEVYVALTVAELAVDEAWTDPTPTTCALAKLLAGAAVETANLHCQQVLGGIGFTWEHPFHHYLRRGRMLAAMLGARSQLASALGAEILNARAAPLLAPL